MRQEKRRALPDSSTSSSCPSCPSWSTLHPFFTTKSTKHTKEREMPQTQSVFRPQSAWSASSVDSSPLVHSTAHPRSAVSVWRSAPRSRGASTLQRIEAPAHPDSLRGRPRGAPANHSDTCVGPTISDIPLFPPVVSRVLKVSNRRCRCARSCRSPSCCRSKLSRLIPCSRGISCCRLFGLFQRSIPRSCLTSLRTRTGQLEFVHQTGLPP